MFGRSFPEQHRDSRRERLDCNAESGAHGTAFKSRVRFVRDKHLVREERGEYSAGEAGRVREVGARLPLKAVPPRRPSSRAAQAGELLIGARGSPRAPTRTILRPSGLSTAWPTRRELDQAFIGIFRSLCVRTFDEPCSNSDLGRSCASRCAGMARLGGGVGSGPRRSNGQRPARQFASPDSS